MTSMNVTTLDNSGGHNFAFNANDFADAENAVFFSRNEVALMPATLYPVRTNNWKNFATDLFLPTVINHALAIENCVGKFFAALFALVLDTVTFPIRLLTCIPRVLINLCRGEHPLLTFLKDNNINDDFLLTAERVHVVLRWDPTVTQISHPASSWETNTSFGSFDSEKNLIRKVNLIDVPMTLSHLEE